MNNKDLDWYSLQMDGTWKKIPEDELDGYLSYGCTIKALRKGEHVSLLPKGYNFEKRK